MENYKVFNTLGDFFKYVRKFNKITMNELAEKAGISQPYLSLIENNKNKPSEDVIDKIASAISSITGTVDEEELKQLLVGAYKHFDRKNLRQLMLKVNTESSHSHALEMSDDTLNLNHILDYFVRKKEVEETNRKIASGEFIDIIDKTSNYNIMLDGKKLNETEIIILRTLLLGIKETRQL